MSRLWTILCLVLPALVSAQDVPTYQAHYRALYKGRNLGHSQFTVRFDPSSGHYTFSSETTPRGLLKLVVPGPVTERSEFVMLPTGLRPLAFSYDDGSRKGEDNLAIAFDWERGVATTTSGSGKQRVAIEPGVLDRGTLQVSLMMDMAAHRPTGPYRLVDGDELETYDYMLDGTETLDVPAGTYATQRYVQRRDGASRSTWLWAAPELSYLAIKIEQRRDGEARSAFVLEEISGLASATAAP